MNEPIITLTPSAMNHIKKNVQQANARGFRLAVKKTGCSGYAYVPDIVQVKQEQDLEISTDELLIYIDKASAPFLKGTVIDFVDQGLGQTKLIFNNPNAANLCGCGESFNLDESFV